MHLRPTPYSPREVEESAASRIGYAQYDMVRDNCEHFARWCVTGLEYIEQSDGLVVGAVVGVGTLLAGLGPFGALLSAVVTSKVWARRFTKSAVKNAKPNKRFAAAATPTMMTKTTEQELPPRDSPDVRAPAQPATSENMITQ